MTPEQLHIIRDAMIRIARGRRISPSGWSSRISRDDQVTIAREACDAVGWDYAVRMGVPTPSNPECDKRFTCVTEASKVA